MISRPRNGSCLPDYRGSLLRDEPMGRHTSWRAGGPARRLFIPADLEELRRFLAALDPSESLLWLGLGSNLLVRDGGFPGTVIATSGLLNGLEARDGDGIRAEAGVPCAKVARLAARLSLGGAEFLAGIPGTMGGALAMNAGAFGGETWGLVERVETIDRAGRVRERSREEYDVGYRQIGARAQEWFLAAHLRLPPADGAASARRIKDLLARRAASQPMGEASCGSVFRNPPGDHAARLIEAAGLKGTCIGAACVSEKHANFIVNRGGATAAEIEELMRRVMGRVEALYGVRLMPEVQVVGEEPQT